MIKRSMDIGMVMMSMQRVLIVQKEIRMVMSIDIVSMLIVNAIMKMMIIDVLQEKMSMLK